MKKKRLLICFAFAIVALFVASCSKDDASDSEAAGHGNIMMRVKTAGSSDGATEMTVAKPINIYVFDSSNKCVALNTAAGENAEADFKLSAGSYTLYAVAGADAANYILPDKTLATPESVVALKDGRLHSDLMCASKNVMLTDGNAEEVILEMHRKVLKLMSVCINNVPDDVLDITATIKSFNENVRLNGEYSGEQAKANIALNRVGTTQTWKNDCQLFLLPSVGKPEIQFSFVTKNGTKKFWTVGDSELTANYKVEINVDYQNVSSPTLKCCVKGVEWDGTKQWNFNIDSSELVDGDNTDGDVEKGDAPEVGTMYKGCYVLTSEPFGNGTRVLLMNPKSKSGLTFTDGDQESIRNAVDAAIAELSVDGIDGWRLPTKGEVLWIKENYEFIKTLSLEEGYYDFASATWFYQENDEIRSFSMASGEDFLPSSKSKSNRLRPLATMTFYKK